MRPRGAQDEAKMGSRRAPWRRSGGLGPLVGAPGWSWAPLGALREALGAVLGALGPLLGPPGARLGLIWASRGAPFGASWASVEGSLAKSRKPRNSSTVQHFLRFFEVPGAPQSVQNRFGSAPRRVWAPLEASWGLLGLSLSLSGPLRGPSAWLLGRPWVAPDRSERTGPRATHVTSSPKIV